MVILNGAFSLREVPPKVLPLNRLGITTYVMDSVPYYYKGQKASIPRAIHINRYDFRDVLIPVGSLPIKRDRPIALDWARVWPPRGRNPSYIGRAR